MKYNRHILDDQKNYKNLENFGEKRKKKAARRNYPIIKGPEE